MDVLPSLVVRVPAGIRHNTAQSCQAARQQPVCLKGRPGGLLPPLLGVDSRRRRSRLFVVGELDWTSMPRLAATPYAQRGRALRREVAPWPRNSMSETPSDRDAT